MKNKKHNSLSRTMYLNVFLNYVLRGISIGLGLFSTSLNISYLGLSIYGQWATIASIASWVNTGDLGIGNGFRNELSKAVANNDIELQKKLIISTVKMLLSVVIVLFCILLVITEVFFATNVMSSSLRLPMYVTNGFFCLDLLLGVGRAAAHGFQKSWLTSLAQVITVGLRIVGVLFLKIAPADLTSFAIVNGVAGFLGNLVLIFVLFISVKLRFNGRLNEYIDLGLRKQIISVGIQFFILQITALVLYSTDNLIINKVLSSEAVAKYDIITKVFSTGEGLFSILLISLWSAVTYALEKGDFLWIQKELKRLLAVWLCFSVGVVIVALTFNEIVKVWLSNNSIHFDTRIIVLFAIYTIWGTFGSIFVNITNGIGRLRIQIFFAIIATIVNIPLSVFLARELNLGIFGVKLATLICCVGANVFVPIDVLLYLKKNRSQGQQV